MYLFMFIYSLLNECFGNYFPAVNGEFEEMSTDAVLAIFKVSFGTCVGQAWKTAKNSAVLFSALSEIQNCNIQSASQKRRRFLSLFMSIKYVTCGNSKANLRFLARVSPHETRIHLRRCCTDVLVCRLLCAMAAVINCVIPNP